MGAKVNPDDYQDYKIDVVKMGAYVGYLYGRNRIFLCFYSKWVLLENAIHNILPYSEKIIEWQKRYNIPDNKVKFDICRN